MSTNRHVVACSAVLGGLLVLAAASCGEGQKTERRDATSGGSGEQSKPADASPAPLASNAFPKDKATATIKGRVTFDGEPPNPKNLAMTEQYCVECHPEGAVAEKFQIDKATKGVAWCLVKVVDADKKWKFETPADPVTIDQVGCVYVPHVNVVMVGQHVTVKSSDATTHNVHWFGRVNRLTPDNITQKKGDSNTWKTFTRPEIAHFKCDVHGWMKSWVHVLNHNLAAVTNAKGEFTLPKLPAGDYELEVWHSDYKGDRVKVTVADNGTSEVEMKVKG